MFSSGLVGLIEGYRSTRTIRGLVPATLDSGAGRCSPRSNFSYSRSGKCDEPVGNQLREDAPAPSPVPAGSVVGFTCFIVRAIRRSSPLARAPRPTKPRLLPGPARIAGLPRRLDAVRLDARPDVRRHPPGHDTGPEAGTPWWWCRLRRAVARLGRPAGRSPLGPLDDLCRTCDPARRARNRGRREVPPRADPDRPHRPGCWGGSGCSCRCGSPSTGPDPWRS